MLRTVSQLAGAPKCFGCGGRQSWMCVDCRRALGPPERAEAVPHVDLLAVPWAYKGAARDLVLALKLRARRPAAGVLADELATHVQSHGTRASLITWVPGRPADIRVRGFDHARLIADELGRRIGLPVVQLVTRVGDPPDQTSLSGADRRRNLAGVFRGRPGPDRVLLVDDLVTTGATVGACARALKDCGASYVDVAAPCRA
jgi:predicted amidophosphoribosyltransferase